MLLLGMEFPKQENGEDHWCSSNFHVSMGEDEPPVVVGKLGAPSISQVGLTEQISGAVSKELVRVLREQNQVLETRIDAMESRLLKRMETLSRPGGSSENLKDVNAPQLDQVNDTGVKTDVFRCRAVWDHPIEARHLAGTLSGLTKIGLSAPANGGEKNIIRRSASTLSTMSMGGKKKKKLQHQMSIWDYEDLAAANRNSKDDEPEIDETEKSSVRRRVEASKCHILHPSATICIAWDLFGVALIAYDTVVIPLFLAYPLDHVPFTVAMFWITLLFWTLDIILTFFKGYYRGNLLEVRPSWIAAHYFKSWLLLDLCIVGVDWLTICLGSDPTSNDAGNSNQMSRLARIGKATRAIRIVRSLRLLRVMKLRQLWNEIQDTINSEYLMIALTVVKLLVMIILIGHIISCAWYALGNTEDGWVFRHGFAEDVDIAYSYLTSLHWSLAQFTPAGNELKPYTSEERFFALVVLIAGLVVSALLVSSITAAMSELRRLNSKSSKALTTLRRYLRQRNIPWQLASRIRKYSEFVVSLQGKQIQEKDVELLKYISVPLQKSLALVVHENTLTLHPMFVDYGLKDVAAFQSLCHTATQSVLLAKSDALFTAGQQATQLWFITRGTLLYLHENALLNDKQDVLSKQWSSISESDAPPPKKLSLLRALTAKLHTHSPKSPKSPKESPKRESELQDRLGPGSWCGEPVLWLDWYHVGTLTARTVCDIVGVSAEKFAEITKKHTDAQLMCVRYAQEYVKRLNGLDATALTDLPSENMRIDLTEPSSPGGHF